MTFVFLGSFTEAHGVRRLTRFGERVELPPELAETTKEHGGIPAIPAEEFDAIGFTEAELGTNPRLRSGAPAEFQAKKEQALAILQKQRGEE